MIKSECLTDVWIKYNQTKDLKIKQSLIEHYAYMVKLVAGRLSIYLNNYVDLEDLMGYGVIGLIDAIDKFNLEKNVKFETYASLRIRGAILDEIRKLDWVPRTLRKKQKELTKAYTELESTLGRTPTDEEMSTKLNINDKEYANLVQETNISSLVSIDEYELQVANIKDTSMVTPEEHMQKQEMLEVLQQAIEHLSEREQMVIQLYYFEELTLKEISSILEVSESRISQLHTKAVGKLRVKLNKYNMVLPL